jgi:hypothetical protein
MIYRKHGDSQMISKILEKVKARSATVSWKNGAFAWKVLENDRMRYVGAFHNPEMPKD